MAAFGRLFAERWRPRQRQHVEIEFTRGVLPAILRRSGARRADADHCRTKEAGGRQNPPYPPQSKPRHGDALIPQPVLEASGKNISRTKCARVDVGRGAAGWESGKLSSNQGPAALQAGVYAQLRSSTVTNH